MAEPPSGALSFLLTDIEGSVELWQRDEEAMSAALARHDALLRGLIEQHNGHVFKGAGDGLWAAFAQPGAALDAALAIQAALQSAAWGELGELRVRVVVHTGDAEYRDGDYFGPTLNRVQRLCEMADGGQILASETTIRLAGPNWSPAASVRSLGELRLRDLRQPLRAFEVAPHAVAGALVMPASDAPESDRGSPLPIAYHGAPRQAASPRLGGSYPGVGGGGLTPRTSAAPVARLRVYMLGGFRIEQEPASSRPGERPRRAGRQLLKCLFTRQLRRIPRDEAYELFWPNSDPDAASSTVRSAVLNLRRAYQPGVPIPSSFIVVEHNTIAIRRDADVWVDADAFERVIAEARRADRPDDLLEEADRLYAGDYLPDDVYDDWASQRRESLRQLWTGLQLELSRCREQRGDVDGAVSALQRLLDQDRCDERATRELMWLLARHGRRSDALRVYQQLVLALRK